MPVEGTVLSGQQGNTEGTNTESSIVDEGLQTNEGQEAPSEQAPSTETEKPEGQPEGAKEEGENQSEEAKEPVVYDIKPPEGFVLDDQALESFSTVFNEVGLDNEGAQKLIEAYAPHVQELVQKAIEGHSAEQASAQTSELEALKVDPEFGGKSWESNRQAAQLAVKQFASPEMIAMLNESGLGNNAHMIRMFAGIGKAIGDDNLVVDGVEGGDKFVAGSLYKNSNMNP